MAKLHGRNGQIAIGSASPETVIGSLSAWTINFTRDKVDVTSFGDTNKTYLAGLKDVSGTFEGFFDTDYFRTLMDESDSDTGTRIQITPSTTVSGFYFQGPAWLDITSSGAVNDAVKVSGTFVANGAWTLQVDGSPV
jgi:hypothetical protein